jgi:hypothetical protein
LQEEFELLVLQVPEAWVVSFLLNENLNSCSTNSLALHNLPLRKPPDESTPFDQDTKILI